MSSSEQKKTDAAVAHAWPRKSDAYTLPVAEPRSAGGNQTAESRLHAPCTQPVHTPAAQLPAMSSTLTSGDSGGSAIATYHAVDCSSCAMTATTLM